MNAHASAVIVTFDESHVPVSELGPEWFGFVGASQLGIPIRNSARRRSLPMYLPTARWGTGPMVGCTPQDR